MRRVGALLVVAFLVAWPWFSLPTSLLGNANTAGIYLLVAVSLVLLTGWVGQISLAQASFVGIGAYVAAMATRSHVGFPLNVILGSVAAGAAAAVLGLVALRVRGLYLAVATLIFAWAADSYLFTATWMGGTGGSTSAPVGTIGRPHTFPYVDFGDRRTFYYVTLATCAAAVFALLNLRDSKVGRAFFAVRGSEIAAASFGIDVVRTKLVAFACAGTIAGLAGCLLVVQQGSVVADQFNLTASLFYLSIAVVGGLASLEGAVAASVLFAGLNELFFRVQALSGYLDVVSAGLLAGVLLLYPGGLAALGAAVRMAVRHFTTPVTRGVGRMIRASVRPIFPVGRVVARGGRGVAARMGAGAARVRWPASVRARLPGPFHTVDDGAGLTVLDEPDGPGDEVFAPVSTNGHRSPVLGADGRVQTRPVLAADGITVQFGGLTAVDGVSLEVREGEIVGLIGPNGAGKTTLFNAISGLNRPTKGTVSLHGTDVTNRPVHARAAAGLARTFQVLQLFPQLDVFENLLVGTHLHSGTGTLSRLVLTKGAVRAELDASNRVEEVLDMLELHQYARRSISGLPFGVLRMVELARALVTGAPLIMLDEPASGLDNAETDRLSEILVRVRSRFGVSMLVIEHDVRMVTALTDYMYVIDRGRPIAQGTPAQIQEDPVVIAAYLGTPASEKEEVPV
jgi:ABC-type branched-subunit amino acid transport system ATPase component/ABC-type branched-subunit amino acid transport system permease subunit